MSFTHNPNYCVDLPAGLRPTAGPLPGFLQTRIMTGLIFGIHFLMNKQLFHLVFIYFDGLL